MNADGFHKKFFGSAHWEIISEKYVVEKSDSFFITQAAWLGPKNQFCDTNQIFTFVTLQNLEQRIRISGFGAAIVSWEFKMPDGDWRDVVLGFDNQESYFTNSPYFGVAVGPCSNRIPGGCYQHEGINHQLVLNEGQNHLHGGVFGFHKKNWNMSETSFLENSSVIAFELEKPLGEDGYPAKIKCQLKIEVSNKNCTQSFATVVDGPVPISPTMHHYFNLSGQSTVADHLLQLNGSSVLADANDIARIQKAEVQVSSIECSHKNVAEVKNTGFDFTNKKSLDEVLKIGGLDTNYFLEASSSPSVLDWAVELSVRDLTLKVSTNLPCVQVYSFNEADACYFGKGQKIYGKNAGICLETQFAPGAVQCPRWGSPLQTQVDKSTYITHYSLQFNF